MKKPSSTFIAIWVLTNLVWLGVVLVLWKQRSPESESNAMSLQVNQVEGGPASLLGTNRGGPEGAETESRAAQKAPVSIRQGFLDALGHDDPVARMIAFSALLGDLNKDNIGEALAAIEGSANMRDGDTALLENFMRSWVRIDPGAAMNYALNEDGKRAFYVQNSDDKLIREWATSDPAAAKAYLDKIPLDHEMNRRSLHANLVMGMAAKDLDGAATYAEENQFGRERGTSISFLADAFAKKGESALQAWVDGIDEDGENRRRDYKEYAISQGAEALAKSDPEAAKAWVEGFLEDGLVGGRALTAAADGLAKTDPGGAADWIMEVAEGRDRSGALAETIGDWAREEPNAAAEWLHGQPLDASTDGAVSALARRITREDPESALAWSAVITNERQQAETMIRVGREWQRRDGAAFDQWLVGNEVPTNVAEYFERRRRQ